MYSNAEQSGAEGPALGAKPDGTGGSALSLDRDDIYALARLMKLPPHDDELVLLNAVATAINQKLNPKAIEAAAALKGEPAPDFTLSASPLGFDTRQADLNEACKVLRLLHIADLRDLQTSVNELVVKVQGITADPKTNSKLGRLGR